MRVFKVPGWIEPLRCGCGGEILLQPWETYVHNTDFDLHYKNRRDVIVGLNFICLKCKRQERDHLSDWGHIQSHENFVEKYEELVLGEPKRVR